METTIPCADSVAFGGDCAGCLRAHRVRAGSGTAWEFACNECRRVAGAGASAPDERLAAAEALIAALDERDKLRHLYRAKGGRGLELSLDKVERVAKDARRAYETATDLSGAALGGGPGRIGAGEERA